MKSVPETPTMDQWQQAILPALRTLTFDRAPDALHNVTLLAYFFWDDDRIETKFYTVECAFLCAFKCYGLMPSVLVVNKETDTIRAFCRKYGVTLQVDKTLTGGVPVMNLDCIQNLHNSNSIFRR